MRILAHLLVIAALCATPLTFAADEKEPLETGERDPARQALKQEYPALTVDCMILKDVIGMVRDQSLTSIHVDGVALGSVDIDPAKARVTLKQSKPATLEVTLNAIMSQLGNKDDPCTVTACGNVIQITTRRGADRFVKRHRKALTEAKKPGAEALDKPLPEAVFDGVGLADTVEFLRDVGGVPIDVDWKSLEAAGVAKNAPVMIHARNVKLAQVLRLALDDAAPTKPIGFKLEGKAVKISQDPAAKDTLPPRKDPQKKDGL